MATLIDGYNLLHASGILPRGRGPGTLQRARQALLNFLAATIDEKDIPRTTVVFDAKDAPPGLSRAEEYRGLRVLYADKYPDADSLIEELIRADSAPRSLTVVSSDHRLQRAAKRRRARAIDSDVWHGELLRLANQRGQVPAVFNKPAAPLSDVEVARWLKEFGITADEGAGSQMTKPSTPAEANTDSKLDDPGSPFPPGYADDLDLSSEPDDV